MLSKENFRKVCLNSFKQEPKHNRLYRTKKINQQLFKALKKVKHKKRILFYYPLGFEADIVQTLKNCRKKYEIVIPFMQGKSFKMVPFRFPLKQKKFGIFEAGDSHRVIKNVDVAIVPVIGVDGNFQRIGFGKGMYDRFFATLAQKPYTIFIQPKLCFTKKHICDSYDISCDILLTPTKKIDRKNRC